MSNAGGVNPQACVTALCEAATQQGVELKVAMVTGDDFIDKVHSLILAYLLPLSLLIYIHVHVEFMHINVHVLYQLHTCMYIMFHCTVS